MASEQESPPLKSVNVVGKFRLKQLLHPSLLPFFPTFIHSSPSRPWCTYIVRASVRLPRLFVSINDQQDVPKGIIKLPNERGHTLTSRALDGIASRESIVSL